MGNIGNVTGVVSFEPLEAEVSTPPNPGPDPDPIPQPDQPLVGTVTGRMHVSQPPLQQLPRGPLSEDAKHLMAVLEGLARI